MLGLLAHPGSFPFTVALALLVLLAVAECAGLILGLGLSQGLERLVPLAPDGFADGAVDGSPGLISQFLSWLRAGEVPLMVLLLVFLAVFGLGGLILQAALLAVAGWNLPGWLAAAVVGPGSLPPVRALARLLGRILPGDETQVVHRDAFIGKLALITLGTARVGSPAQARLRDRFGQAHYVMVEPDTGSGPLEQGREVVLVERRAAVFIVIAADHPALPQQPG